MLKSRSFLAFLGREAFCSDIDIFLKSAMVGIPNMPITLSTRMDKLKGCFEKASERKNNKDGDVVMSTERFKIVPLPENYKPGWAVKINGIIDSSVKEVQLESNFGTVHYGMRPEGFDGPVWEEKAGMVTLLVAVSPDGEKYVGMPRENRPNMGTEPVFCILGGMAKGTDTKTCCELAKEVAAQKAGIDASSAEKYRGLHVNSNRLYWVCDPKESGRGVHCYRLVIFWNDLEEAEDGFYKLKETFSVGGKSDRVRFFPIKESPQMTGDALAHSAILYEICEFGC